MSTQEVAVKGRVTRSYSAQERAKALALYDTVGSLEKTSQTLNIPLSTLAGWAANDAHVSEARSKNGIELAQKFENAAHLFLDLAVKKSKRAAFNHLMTAAGISTDKSQLLKGLPTSITETVERNELTVILSTALGELDGETGVIEAEGWRIGGDGE